MDEKQVNEILDDPKNIFNFFRLFHQFVHLYDERELKKEIEKQRGNPMTKEKAGLGDTLSIVLRDNKGNIKKEIIQ
jgi:hypothetical protein